MEESVKKYVKKRDSALISYGWDGACCEYCDEILGFIIWENLTTSAISKMLTYIYIYTSSSSSSVICQTTGPKPLPK